MVFLVEVGQVTGTVHEVHHIAWYDGSSPWPIPGSHVSSPLSLETELLADHLGMYTSTQPSGDFSDQSNGLGGGGGGGGGSGSTVPENLAGCSFHHCRPLPITATSSPSLPPPSLHCCLLPITSASSPSLPPPPITAASSPSLLPPPHHCCLLPIILTAAIMCQHLLSVGTQVKYRRWVQSQWGRGGLGGHFISLN